MYTIDNGWNPVTGLYYVNGQEVSEDEFNRQQVQKFITQSRSEGDTTLGDLFNSDDYQGATTRGTPGQADHQGLYNWGNGQSSWVPLGDSRFVPAPQHQDSLAESNGDWINMNNNGGHMIPLLALTAGTIGGAAGAEGAAVGEGTGAAISGAGTAEGVGTAGGAAAGGSTAGAGTAGGSAFVGDIPVAGEAGTSIYGTAGTGTTGAGTLGNTSGAETVTGSTANDTLGSTQMGDYDPGYFYDSSGNFGTQPTIGGDPGYAGNNNDPGYMYDSGGNYGTAPGTQSPSSNPYSLSDINNVSKALGITPASALKYLTSNGGGAALGGALAAGIGAVGANQQAGRLQALNNQYMGLGAPSRARYESSFQPGFTMANDPGYTDALNQSAKATLHGMSVQGNPAGSPNAWTQTLSDVNAKFAYPALKDYRNQNANTGGIGQLTAAAPGMASGAINAQGNVFNALGAGANDIFNPPKSLAQQLAELKQSGLYA